MGKETKNEKEKNQNKELDGIEAKATTQRPNISIGILCVGNSIHQRKRETTVISRFWYIEDGYICIRMYTQYIGSFIIFTLGARFPMHTKRKW